jgi:hypothetical protein
MALTMTADEKYLFDLNGFIVVRNVLSPEEVAVANEVPSFTCRVTHV